MTRNPKTPSAPLTEGHRAVASAKADHTLSTVGLAEVEALAEEDATSRSKNSSEVEEGLRGGFEASAVGLEWSSAHQFIPAPTGRNHTSLGQSESASAAPRQRAPMLTSP